MVFVLPRAALAAALVLADKTLLVSASQLPMEMASLEGPSGGTFVTDLSQCPPLPPRSSRPASVNDLRPDDIQVTMAIGDSITAGCFSKGIQPDPLTDFTEWRGASYAIGMDPGAITLSNLIKHYNPSVTGGSVGHNGFPEVCFGPICPTGGNGWNEAVDQLNAAQTGALVENLMHEVRDYLVPQVKKMGIPDAAWKHIMLQVGSNDLCQLCWEAEFPVGPGSADDFETKIRAVLEYLKANLPNTIVNLTAVFKVSSIYKLTLNQPYCERILPFVPHFNWECTCALLGGDFGVASRKAMDDLQAQYNERLVKIVSDYQHAHDPRFAVTYIGGEVPLADYPIESLSDVDCFHPSLDTHRFIAAGMWNRLAGDNNTRMKAFAPWTRKLKFRCLEEGDRIITNALIQ